MQRVWLETGRCGIGELRICGIVNWWVAGLLAGFSKFSPSTSVSEIYFIWE